MEPEVSLPSLKTSVTRPYPKPDQYNQCSPSRFIKIHLNIIFTSRPGSSKWSLSFRFPHPNPVYTSFLPIRVTCPTHLTLLITRTIFGEEYSLLSSSLCSSLHFPVPSSPLGPNILFSTRF